MPKKWRGITVSFGLVNVPVAIGKVIDNNGVSAKLVCAEHGLPVRQRYYCETGDHTHENQEELARAFPHNGNLVTPDKDDIAALLPERDSRVEIQSFCPVEQIDPMWYETTYLMWAEKGSEDSFNLLATVIADMEMAAIGKTVLTNRERIAVLRYSPATETMLMHLCAFNEQVRWADVGVSKIDAADPEDETYKVACQLVEAMRAPFDPEQYHDEYKVALQGLIEATREGKPMPVKKIEPATEETPDLLASLKKSIPNKPKTKRAPARKKKEPARRKAVRK